MNSRLRNMLVGVGVFALGGVGVLVLTPQPAGRTMLELRDAGIIEGQPVVVECPERLTAQTQRRINAAQPGVLRPRQAYARIARTGRCFTPDGGNCFRADTGAARVGDLEAELIIPSLRRNLAGIDLDASVGLEDGGDSDDVDDSLQFDVTGCTVYGCTQYDNLIDAGTRSNPFRNRYCSALNRLSIVPSPCMLPDPWKNSTDGGWSEVGTVDCRFTGPYGEADGGPRWRGYNTGPREFAVGSDCLPTECVIISGDPLEFL